MMEKLACFFRRYGKVLLNGVILSLALFNVFAQLFGLEPLPIDNISQTLLDLASAGAFIYMYFSNNDITKAEREAGKVRQALKEGTMVGITIGKNGKEKIFNEIPSSQKSSTNS